MTSSRQRKSPRVDVELDVFIQTVDGDVPCRTRDASYEGVYIVRQSPLPLRKLIRFRTVLPDSEHELQMLGLVAHTVNPVEAQEQGRDPGMGIQLFSLGQKTRDQWREFVDGLYEANPDARRTFEMDRDPVVELQVPNSAMLRKLRTVDLPNGRIFVHTADLYPAGTHVECRIIHPVTGDDFSLDARVVEVVDGSVHDRGLRLDLELPDDRQAMQRFLDGK